MTNETAAVTPQEVNDAVVGVDGASDYNADKVKLLQDAAHVRLRPGMYIGDTSTSGLHHLVYELVYNSVDEALAGYCKTINVKVNVDGSLSVMDDGRGIPVDMHPELKIPTLEVVMTRLGAGAKFDKKTYKTSAGLHGMGAKAVTALSEWTEAEVRRNGRVYHQEYERGKATSEVKDIGAAGNRTGTTVTFKPDPEIFKDVTFDYDTLEMRFRELAFLNKGLHIRLADERTHKEDVFKYDGGLAEFVQYLNRAEDVLNPPIYLDRTLDDIRVEVAIQYTTSDDERVRCYTNNAYNPVGGTHLSGFRAAITRALGAYGNKENSFKNGTPISEDFREGMTAVVSVQVPDPQFESNNKLRLNNPEVEGAVTSILHEYLTTYLEENPKDAQKIMKKVAVAAEAREAAAKAKKAIVERKKMLSGGGLPGKLMDCTSRERDETELFLVEGDSAGGSAESGRDRRYQAILPLRGKPLNVEKTRLEKMLNNEEICSLISAVGMDIGNSEDMEKLRYAKIVILTDADVDGQHIRTLLLTFFYRQMRKLITEGHIYVARPPLFKVTQKKNVRYVQTIEEMSRELFQRGLDGTKLTVLGPPSANGENAPTEATFENDRLASLLRILGEMEESLVILERRGVNFANFLTQSVNGKLPSFRVLLGGHEHWFFSNADVDTFRQRQQQELGHELVVADESGRHPSPNGNGHNGHAQVIAVQELHEVRQANRALERLREFSLQATDLVPAPRIAGREPPPRFILQNGDMRHVLPHLRELVAELKKLGEKGLTITRFKGLGEMDGTELWETTLDPANRTLMKVHIDMAADAEAELMFRTLMGEKVEPRREFIQKHALEVKEIDYHGA